ncbi:MAG: DUF4493 domain-containing protein [Bacteroidaceae bacterium]|nr:DUF4493 domain-containing protein [Bacteroidaceae bacterium]
MKQTILHTTHALFRRAKALGHSWLLCLTACVTLLSCSTDVLESETPCGSLLLTIPGVSAEVSETRSAPAELGAPTAQDFHVKVQREGGGVIYDGPYTSEKINAAAGTYSVSVSCGENAVIGRDAPYYAGNAQATVLPGSKEPTPVSVAAKVANALVSAVFGADEEEKARFEKFYSDYALYVYNGDFGMPILKDEPLSSIYFPAGSHIRLRFCGTLRADGREVSCYLTSPDFPDTFSAADHAIVTLTLPNPESVLTVGISKVEVEQVTLDETIPLSWLPVPTATFAHQYTAAGDLIGTDLTFSDTYPGMTWRAVVTNASGAEVRTVEGSGTLSSAYSSSAAWPFLPAGLYKATYYLLADNKASKVSSREFRINEPNLSLSVGGYTSYTKYQAGEINAANACDRLTVYAPSASVNIDESLLSNANYSYSMTCRYKGAAVSVPAGKKSFAMSNQTEAVSANTYTFNASVSFCSQSLSNQREFRITGLPVSFAPPVSSNWSTSGTVSWDQGYVQLGHRGGLLTENDEYIRNTTSVSIPSGTTITMDYNIMIHPATMGTTFSVVVGTQTIFSQNQGGGLGDTSEHPFRGSTGALTASSAISQIQCNNTYGGGQTYTNVYSLTFNYGTK